MTARAAFALCAIVGSSCRSRPSDSTLPRAGQGDGGAVAARGAQPLTAPAEVARASNPNGDTTSASGAAAFSSATPVDLAGSIYPRNLPPHPKAVELCDALHGVAARRKAECCGGEPSEFLASECARTLGATLHAGTAELDETVALRCLNAVKESVGSCDSITPGPAPLPAACSGLLRGRLASGKVCRSSLECEGDLHCEGSTPTRTGVCTPPAAVGAGCGAHLDVLATYTGARDLATSHPFCTEFCSMATHKCEPLPAAGQPCSATVNCAAGQLCISGRCSATALAREGERCGAVPCDARLRCVSGVCAPLAKTGEACRADEDCERGGCSEGDEGHSLCGPKCNASLGILRRPDTAPAMRLPRARRTEPGAQ